jgi:hypothetical protein
MAYLPVELRTKDADDFEAGDYYACPELREAVNAVLGDEKGKGLFKLQELCVVHWSNDVRACARKALGYWWYEDLPQLQLLREQIEARTQGQIEKALLRIDFLAQGEQSVTATNIRPNRGGRIAPRLARGRGAHHAHISGDSAKQRALKS